MTGDSTQVIVIKAKGSDQEAKAILISEKHEPLWLLLHRIMYLAKRTDVLALDELDELEEKGQEFVSAFRRTFPGEHISIKLHFLETHLIDFARIWGTAGLFSEDGAESIHALINTFERRFASVKGQDKDRSIVSALEMQQDEGVARAKRDRMARRARPTKKSAL